MTDKEAIAIGKRFEQCEKAIEIAVDAIEKQIPKKPLKYKLIYLCPNCYRPEYIKQRGALDTHCGFCGQAIDWSEVENEIENND